VSPRDSGRVARPRGPAATVAVLLALAAAAAAIAAGPAAATAADGTDETTVVVALTDAPDGLAGYELTLELEAGTVVNASYPDAFRPTTDPAIAGDGRSVTLEAADVADRITAGDSPVRLATVRVRGVDGTPAVSVRDASIDADGGARIDPANVTVSAAGSDTQDPSTDAGSSTPGPTGTGADGTATDGGTEAQGADGPGFGPLAALGALAALAVLAVGRRA